MSLTKSLHTITATVNVARYRLTLGAHPDNVSANTLAHLSLSVLGYPEVDTSPKGCAADVTVDRIVRQIAKVIEETRK